jgi:hypothetical protein
MKNTTLIIALLLLLPTLSESQILPKEGGRLNYRLIGFSPPIMPKAISCKIEIARDSITNEDTFKKKVILTYTSRTNKIIGEVPDFGKQYTWRAVYKLNETKMTYGELHHFSTNYIPETDTALTRLRIIKSSEKYEKGYVFIDGVRVMYDMKGNPVWFLPPIEGNNSLTARDMKLTNRGTISFLIEGYGLYEVNYDGDIVWKKNQKIAATDDEIEHYLYELTRLKNGHYMVMSSELAWWDTMSYRPDHMQYLDSLKQANKPFLEYQKIRFGTVLEYDEHGDLVWRWKSADYFKESDLVNYKKPNRSRPLDVHENAFYFDEVEKELYVGFQNISRIVKIRYPGGTIIKTYGEQYRLGIPESGNGVFCNQQNMEPDGAGNLLVFNTNNCNVDSSPKVMVLKEPTREGESLQSVWEYEFPIRQITKDYTNGVDPKIHFHNKLKNLGGTVTRLADRAIFASVCSLYSYAFIVNYNKELQWCAVSERLDPDEKVWGQTLQYNASIIPDPKEVEKLIWDMEIKK